MLIINTNNTIQKASERQRARAAINRQERAIREAFNQFLRDTKNPDLIKQVEGFLARGRIGQALSILDQHIMRLGDAMNRALLDAAQQESERIARELRATGVTTGISFNPADERVVNAMRNNKLEFVRQFTRQQRESTRNALVESIRDGKGPREVARAFRDSIGLTDYQRRVVANYQDALERGSRDALNRMLRDRRFDSTVERAIEEGDVLSADQIEMMVGRYTERMLRMRSETIARTEGHRIANEGQHEAFEQVLEQAVIPDDMVEREWVATDDDRTRDSHAEMDGQIVQGMDEPFVSPSGARMLFPGDTSYDAPPEELINCRCSILRRIKGGVSE